ncbi:hypothetical protein COY95_03125 [Candidatus Woesearchaeota archaeon CG_4_10_14_0_8_um_filter_47_5]|nr:MAG: hypothetical protein COY95_03125 [Candidatus Woesearchaeota archaeon CG_4_10_14_0_8_um_filter_47_5]
MARDLVAYWCSEILASPQTAVDAARITQMLETLVKTQHLSDFMHHIGSVAVSGPEVALGILGGGAAAYGLTQLARKVNWEPVSTRIYAAMDTVRHALADRTHYKS